jgi:pimeloyl-ACP methyl ester carboxylesterase
MDVPLNWDDPQGESIEIAVLQVPGQGRNVIGTLWFLDGGPGGTGVGLADEDILGPYRKAGFDIYIPVHRGTGMSTPLTCSQPIFSNMPACANELVATWGEGLAHFRSAQAGRDLGALIQAAAPPAQPVFVYGTSYGTYWALRYLQSFPEQANGVILDGVLDLEADVLMNDVYANDVGISIMEQCQQDPVCGAAFNGDPHAAVERVFDGLDTAACPPLAGMPRFVLSGILFGLLSMEPQIRALVPGFIYRADRCTGADAGQIQSMLEFMLSFSGPQGRRWDGHGNAADFFNDVLHVQVVQNDLLGTLEEIPFQALEQASQGLYYAPTAWQGLAADFELWPHFPVPDNHLIWPETQVPVLLLNGALDLQTVLPWAERAASYLDGDHQHLVVFPTAGHGVARFTETPDGGNCAHQIILDFLAEPTSSPNLACIENIPPIDFAGETDEVQNLSKSFFGSPALFP